MNQEEQAFHELTKDLDVPAFWEENERCWDLTTRKPRCPLSFSPDDHWLFGLLPGISTLRYYRDKTYRDQLHRECNRLTLAGMGQAFFEEDTWEHPPRRIENFFGCEFTYTEGATPWLTPVTEDPLEFARALDRAECTDIHSWALTDGYRQEWQARKERGQMLPRLGTGSRGPATVMTSILRPETVFYWFVDHPLLMQRFRDLLAAKMIELNTVLRAFSACNEPGWWITDDNCALFNLRYYREYCVPVLRAVLEEFAPLGARRYQHSDSAMGHLLEEQRGLGISECNYGPTVSAGLIRAKLPQAVICGQLPPMLLRDGSPEAIRAWVRRDFEQAGASGRLVITTAGSLSSGTGLGRMRWLMKVVQEESRYL